jgi:hypothetical protein
VREVEDANAQRRREFMQADLPAAVEMAERLGFPALAKSLAETFTEVAGSRIAPGLRSGQKEFFRIHRLRLRVALSHLLARKPDADSSTEEGLADQRDLEDRKSSRAALSARPYTPSALQYRQ